VNQQRIKLTNLLT